MAETPRVLVLFGSVVLFGAERGNIEALSALKEHGAEILCLVSDEPWNTTIPPALDAAELAWRKVPYVHLAKGLGWSNWLWRNPRRFVKANIAFFRAVREFKATHIHLYSQSQVVNFAWGLMRSKLPIVYRAGDEPTLHNLAWRLAWTFSARRVTQFVANSQFVARSLRANGVAAEKVTVIYNRPPARPSAPGAVLDLQLPVGARVIGYVGQIAEHKGPHVLVEAFREVAARFPDARLLLAGRISDWQGDAWARELRDTTKADPLIGNRIMFLGEIEDVPGFLARCEVLVVPSLFDDPSPNVVMEAKQAGRAVIAFPRGGLPELVEHGVDGLLCRHPSRSDLVEALNTYLENPSMARAHSAAAVKASTRFGNLQFAGSWARVYASARIVAR